MYRLGVTIVLLFPLAIAYAGPDDDKRAAANRKLERSDRIAACTRLIDNVDLTEQEHAQAHLQRGILHRFDAAWDQAIDDFDHCLRFDPGNPEAHRNRGFVFYNTDRYVDAESEFTKALEADPRNKLHFYLHRARVQLKQFDQAIADYSQALLFDPRYFDAYTGRARVHRLNDNNTLAIADCDAALSIDPYVADAYFVRGLAREASDEKDGAIHDFAIAFSLDPNIDGPESGLKRLGAVDATMDAGKPVPFAPPKDGVTITYLQTGREQAKASESDEFMADLVGWFKKKRVPVPTRRMFITRKILSSADGFTNVAAGRREDGLVALQKKNPIRYYRSLWTTRLPGPSGLTFDVGLDRKSLDRLWPLSPETRGEGTGALELEGPDPLTPQAIFLGCKKPGDVVPVGTSSWKGGSVGWERVVVPAGVFETVKLTFEDSIEVNFFGRKNKQTSTLTFWYAPDLHWWVKRTREGNGQRLIDEAVAVE